jgi:hypothetical protein
MVTLGLILLVLAFVLIFLAAIKIPEHPRVSYGWMGVAIVVLVYLLGMVSIK